MNLSVLDFDTTARTQVTCARQRASYLSDLGINSVLELCVGPSLKTLELAYAEFSIGVTGNDIDKRWVDYYPQGNWIIGDAMEIDHSGFDCIVFAPPLSQGCSGKREDALSIYDVVPSYFDFIKRLHNKLYVLVLPGRSFSTQEDRNQFYHLGSSIYRYDLIPLISKGISKYYDLVVDNR